MDRGKWIVWILITCCVLLPCVTDTFQWMVCVCVILLADWLVDCCRSRLSCCSFISSIFFWSSSHLASRLSIVKHWLSTNYLSIYNFFFSPFFTYSIKPSIIEFSYSRNIDGSKKDKSVGMEKLLSIRYTMNRDKIEITVPRWSILIPLDQFFVAGVLDY